MNGLAIGGTGKCLENVHCILAAEYEESFDIGE